MGHIHCWRIKQTVHFNFFTTAPPGYCRSFNGSLYKIGDTWKPSPLETCSCTASNIIECCFIFLSTVAGCVDSSGNTRTPGDMWLYNPRWKCVCIEGNLVNCDRLHEPMCQDISGIFRKNMETWTKGSCVECACINGTINCNLTIVNITYGLFNASVFPISELYSSQAPQTSSACKGNLQIYWFATKCWSETWHLVHPWFSFYSFHETFWTLAKTFFLSHYCGHYVRYKYSKMKAFIILHKHKHIRCTLQLRKVSCLNTEVYGCALYFFHIIVVTILLLRTAKRKYFICLILVFTHTWQ